MDRKLFDNFIESVQPNPVTVDLDVDGNLEILYPSYDGRMHAFWLDKSEHGNWPFQVYNPSEGFLRFASEPVVADLDGDGKAEVIFASWTQKGSNHSGKLLILDYLGNPIYQVDLPAAFGSPDWNGSLAAPTLADIAIYTSVEVASGSACDSQKTAPSHTLLAMGVNETLARCAVRVSIGKDNSEQDIDAFIQVLEQQAQVLRGNEMLAWA